MSDHCPDVTQTILLLDPFRVKPFKDQPRKRFRGIAKLAESIRLVGQVTPILVTPCDEQGFDAELVDGERRLQACREGKMQVKAVMEGGRLEGPQRFALSVAANFCRQGHDAMEVAEAIRVLRESGRTAEEIAGIFGKSIAWVYQHAYLLEMSPVVQSLLCRAAKDEGNRQVRRPGRITMLLALLMRPLPHAQQAAAANRIVKRKLSFSEARKYIAARIERHKAGGNPKRSAGVQVSDWQRFWNATLQYRPAAEKLATMDYAKLQRAMEAIPPNQCKAVAEQLSDLAADLRGILDAIKQRARA